jgi:hypothetical protein
MFLDGMEFGFEPEPFGLLKPTISCIAPLVIAAGISAAVGVASSLMAGDAPEGYEPEVLPKTVSGNVVQDMNFVFDLEAGDAMKNLTTQLNEWSGADRDFFENVFQPFQESLIEANQALIPGIVENSGEAMKQNLKDLMGGDFLKDAFRSQISQSGADVSKFAQSFSDQIDKIPTAEQRVGQAVAGVEQRFGQAGVELKRMMGAKGLDVSQASQRDLAIQKATATAGAADAAAEAARKEQLAGAAAGVEVASGIQTSQANMLTAQQELTQAGVGLGQQIGGVQDTAAVSTAGKIGAELTTSGAEKVLGTQSETKKAEFTQVGVVKGVFFDKDTGENVDAAGNVAKITPPREKIRLPSTRISGYDLDNGLGPGNAPGGVGIGADGGMTGGAGGVGVGAGDSPGSGGGADGGGGDSGR